MILKLIALYKLLLIDLLLFMLRHCNISFLSELDFCLLMIVNCSDSKVLVIDRGISTIRSSRSILWTNFDCKNLKSGISFEIAAEGCLTVFELIAGSVLKCSSCSANELTIKLRFEICSATDCLCLTKGGVAAGDGVFGLFGRGVDSATL